MPLINSKNNKVIRDYSIEELKAKAREMRAYNMISIHAAGSGHPGGTLSIMDITAALYLKVARHDPGNPGWEDRDRIFWSAGHKAPALYIALAEAGYFPVEDVVKLRKLGSGFEGHPNRLKLPGVELSSGSLGQGLGVAIGSALNARLQGRDYRVFCIMGDGEQDEGSIWESVMCASHYKLDNIVGIVDKNNLQIDGPTKEVMCISPLADKYRAFCWNVIEIDGHDMEGILKAFDDASRKKGMPTVIIANTVKGKGVSYAENVVGYHGVAPKDGRSGKESLDKALEDIADKGFTKEKVDALLKTASDYQAQVDRKIKDKLPKFSRDYWWNSQDDMKVEMKATRMGFGDALDEIGADEKIVAHGADITSSIKMDMFFKNHPERKKRFFSVGIAEANMLEVASGLAKEGRISFVGSYGVFATGRAWDQIRTTACYNELDVKIADAHGGISVGADGATHQALEEIAVMSYIPNITVTVPCDSDETYKITKAVAYRHGPAVIRYAREATPLVTGPATPFEFGKANVIRYRGRRKNFAEAFGWKLAGGYKSEKEDISLIACGPMVPEAMRAAYILKEEYGIEARVLDVHTVKPLDTESVLKAAMDTQAVVTCEEHQVGGFGNIIAGVIMKGKKYSSPLVMDMVGVEDIFGESGSPWELMIDFELVAENIALKAKDLVEKKKSR
ncbi:MAG: transketolase [Elusimicrobia bacterium]|nr:transketolase [Elusimicrobiota bacterium]